eukprot:TRINITY_DN8837_c0_g1_i1.p1 TRINITY_DN8837_c0_g1~~TRINITY_DN8837_c0_g1_i1.p1  ORF type:complete len:151 (-),score=2.45 TRINITY_DN8837_c0_g1_i1:188-595(-)
MYIKLASLRQRTHPFGNLLNSPIELSQPLMEQNLQTIVKVREIVIIYLRDLFFWKDVSESTKACVVCLILRFIGIWVSSLVLVYIAFLASFIWPRLYDEKKPEIDAIVEKTTHVVKKQLILLSDKLPPSLKLKLT